MAAKTSLVIVESPSKAKTIGKYLGEGYQVKACMGHLRDLPKSTIGVDIENDFEPEYIPIKGKEAVIKDLKKSADSSSVVYLATDPDREGEAISWHLKYLLKIPEEKAKRVTFNEITKKVVTESIQKPRSIDQDLVDAQQARRVLDRIVGYKISPVMWKKIRRGLSAGRVQSVATRMVDDRDREIEEFQPQEYWTLDVLLKNAAEAAFKASYYGVGGKKAELHSEDDVLAVQRDVQDKVFTVASVKRTGKQRSPAPPFTTSTMQQDASYKLNMAPRRTMAIAQQLYEGIDITGEGTVGLITYMRTDSLRISAEAQQDAASFIKNRFGDAYCPEKPRQYKSKGNAQDAHEAIRPSNVLLTPERIRGDLTYDQFRLYSLIWHRFLASQMENAVYDNLNVAIFAGSHEFRASASKLKFPGYQAAYDDSKEETSAEKAEKKTLPELSEGEAVAMTGFEPAQHFTQPPAHYTEATLIRAMEEQGIGRPSTYAPTVSTILDRRYVKKDGKYLVITNLGESVTRWMKRHFSNIEDTKFTANMEQQLDDVEAGTVEWKNVLRSFYVGFEQQVDSALKGEREPIEPVVSDEICPVCGKNLVEREGKFGTFLGCPGFPDCTFTMPIVEVMPGRCHKCGGRLLKRTGISKNHKQYIYYCCEFNNTRAEVRCDFSTWDVPTAQDCPECGQTMFKKSGRGRMTPFCINEACANFLPEEKRGYRKKTADTAEEAETGAEKKSAPKKPTAKKTTAKKSAAKKPEAKKKTGTAGKTKEKAE